MKTRHFYLALCLFVSLMITPQTLAADQVVPFGVIDLAKILRTFYQESEDYRNYFAVVEEMERREREMNNDIDDLISQKISAENRNYSSTVSRLEREIQSKKEDLNEYKRIMDTRIRSIFENLQSTEFYAQVQRTIELVAESKGFLQIFDSNDSGLIW